MKVILIVVAIIAVLYFAFVAIFGNWRMTLNRVITTFVAITMKYPNATIGHLFYYTLDARYPLVTGGHGIAMYHRKEAVGRAIHELSTEEPSPVKVLLRKHTLPSLILRCLLIERNSITRKYDRNPQRLYDAIEEEVKRQGYSRYCREFSYDDCPELIFKKEREEKDQEFDREAETIEEERKERLRKMSKKHGFDYGEKGYSSITFGNKK